MSRRRLARLAGVALLASTALLLRFAGNTAGGADSSGYLASARLLARGRLSEPVRTIQGIDPSHYPREIFAPLGMRPGRLPGTLVPTYPVGLPLHIAIASFVVGEAHAPSAVNALAWIALAVLLYRLARSLGLPRSWSAVCVSALAVFPVTVLQAIRPMSDLLATTWCVAAVAFALRSGKRRTYALAAGASFAVAVLVRPTDALLVPAIALAIGPNPALLALAAAGAAPVLAALGAYNLAEYGAALTTGYSGVGPLISVRYLWRGLAHFGRWLATFLGLPVLALVGVGAVKAVRGDRRQAVLLVWAGALIGFYSLYEQSLYGWWRLRFLLPALPAILLSAFVAAHDLAGRVRSRRPGGSAARRLTSAALFLSLLWCLGASLYWVVKPRIWGVGASEDPYPECVELAERNVPSNAVFMAMQTSGAIHYYGRRPIVRYDLMDERTYMRFRADARNAGVPVYALLFRIDRLAFERRWPDGWEPLGTLGEASLWRPRATGQGAAKPVGAPPASGREGTLPASR